MKLRDILLGSTVGLAAILSIAASPLNPNEFTSAASLRALPAGQFAVVHRFGFSQYGDGGEGDYYWSATSVCVDDGGTCLAPAGGGSGRLVLPKDKVIRPEMFGAKGYLLPPIMGNGIATTSGSTTFSNVTVPAAYVGQPVRISGVGLGGNSFDSTISSPTTFAGTPFVTQSIASPTYFSTDFTIFTPASAGCAAAAILTAPAPTNGTVTGGSNTQITIDTVSTGVFATGHISQGGIYTASNPFGNLAYTTFTGGGCATNITASVGIDKAGSYIIGPDDTVPLQTLAAAVASGYRNVEVMPGAVYQVRATIAPGGPNGSSAPSSILSFAGSFSANLYGATFVNASWHNTDNGWSYLMAVGGVDRGSIRGLDLLQWPFPHRMDNKSVDHPNGTWGIVLNGPANDWAIEDVKCRGAVVGAHILGSLGSLVSNTRNSRPVSDGCVYGATATGTVNSTIENVYTQTACRSLFLRSNYNLSAKATARNAFCNTVLIENAGNGLNVFDGLDLRYQVLPRLSTDTFTATTTIGSRDLTLSSAPDKAPFLWGLSGVGIPAGTVAMRRDGSTIRMSQPATAAGSITVTATIPPNTYGFSSSEVTIGAGIASARYANMRINVDYDGTGYQAGTTPLVFSVQNFGAAAAATFLENIILSGSVRNLPAGPAGPCVAAGSNWDVGCIVNIGDHASAPWNTSQAYGISIRDFTVFNNIGANPGGIHLDANIMGTALSPLKMDNVLLPAAAPFTVENDAFNTKWDWPGKVFTFTPIWKFGGASVGQTYTLQQGTWTRNGKQTTVNIRTQMTAKGSSVGSASIAMPAAPSLTNTSTIASNCAWINGMAAGVGALASVPGATPDFGFAVGPGTGGVTATLADTHFTNASDLGCTFNYASQ